MHSPNQEDVGESKKARTCVQREWKSDFSITSGTLQYYSFWQIPWMSCVRNSRSTPLILLIYWTNKIALHRSRTICRWLLQQIIVPYVSLLIIYNIVSASIANWCSIITYKKQFRKSFLQYYAPYFSKNTISGWFFVNSAHSYDLDSILLIARWTSLFMLCFDLDKNSWSFGIISRNTPFSIVRIRAPIENSLNGNSWMPRKE